MKKWVKIGFPIICIVIVGGTLVAVGNLTKNASKNSKDKTNTSYDLTSNTSYYSNNTNSNLIKNENIILDTNTNTNRIDNTSTNTLQNNITNTNTKNTTNSKQSEETETDLAKIDDKEKAIALAAAEWGEDSSVYYTNEGISSGYYIVAVRDKSNTSVKMFYKVDIKNNTVEIDW